MVLRPTYNLYEIDPLFISLLQSKQVGNERLEQHIHFWLGLEASHDEATVAAYKTVELDDHLVSSL